ncbi:hypothetical protein [Salinigranum halophilum]|uniref:hypothetical protein n=1 Tax=Salinigranum halophilum TaxID=2565931 RepID=UPI00115E6A3C|nr:hypothetical protein [Salinigranum halophilum]
MAIVGRSEEDVATVRAAVDARVWMDDDHTYVMAVCDDVLEAQELERQLELRLGITDVRIAPAGVFSDG